MPDLSGRALREVLEVCSLLEVKCVYSGSGYVSAQLAGNTADTDYVFIFEPAASRNAVPETDEEDLAEENGGEGGREREDAISQKAAGRS